MRPPNIFSIRNIVVGLLALLAVVPLMYAERPQQPGREQAQRSAPAQVSRPSPRPAPVQRQTGAVDRFNHGTLRHIDAQVVRQPVTINYRADVHRNILAHHDIDVDIHRTQFWHGFVFGVRIAALRAGYFQLFINGAPYYYDDGIYYQQTNNFYQEIYPPAGAVVMALPDGAVEIDAGNIIYYYAGGAFYTQNDSGFVIVAAPMGILVPEPPQGAVQVFVNGIALYQFNGVYYQPIFNNGVTQYITVSM